MQLAGHRSGAVLPRKNMNWNRRSYGTRPGFARRLLACLLAVLLGVQPIAWASWACSRGGRVSGQEVCCCPDQSSIAETSCCSTEQPNRGTSGASILSPLDRCTCELQAPAPFPALPRQSGLRGAERGSDGGLAGWIESGALASASTPIPEWASRPGEVCPRIDGLRPSDSQTAAILARGHRGLLDLLCVARC